MTQQQERTCTCGHPMMQGPLRVRRDGEERIAAWWCANCHHAILWTKGGQAVKANERRGNPNALRELDRIASELADALGIDAEYVMTEPPTHRISISAKQAARIVEMLRKESR